jgi:hypothetical protein
VYCFAGGSDHHNYSRKIERILIFILIYVIGFISCVLLYVFDSVYVLDNVSY